MAKIAKTSGFFTKGPDYACKHPWPEDCFCQGGGDGLVIGGEPNVEKVLTDPKEALNVIGMAAGTVPTPPQSYRTAFFEAFPTSPKTFLRGEGATISDAEDDCWKQYLLILECATHVFERKGYRSGAAICKKCGLFNSKAFDPLEICEICGIACYHSYDIDNKWYCAEHANLIPKEKRRPSLFGDWEE